MEERAKAEMEKEQIQNKMILSLYKQGIDINVIATAANVDISYIEKLIHTSK